MTKEDAIKQCRYYKGQKKCPANTDEMFWNYERLWVEWMLEAEDEKSWGAQELKLMMKRYKDVHLEHFQEDDGVPITFKALLFNRFEHWNEGDGFEDWYLKNYIRE